MTEMITKLYNQGTVLIVTTQLSNWTLCMSKSKEEGEELPSVINQINYTSSKFLLYITIEFGGK